MTELPSFNPRDYFIIGRLHAHQNPESVSAEVLLTRFKEAKSKALDDNLHRINWYFHQFCKLTDINPFEYLGQLNKTDKVRKRKLFIGAMVRIYHPQLFTYEINDSRGVFEALCIVLYSKSSSMSIAMDEIKGWYADNLYNYQDDVTDLVEKLINLKNYGHTGLFNFAPTGT